MEVLCQWTDTCSKNGVAIEKDSAFNDHKHSKREYYTGEDRYNQSWIFSFVETHFEILLTTQFNEII